MILQKTIIEIRKRLVRAAAAILQKTIIEIAKRLLDATQSPIHERNFVLMPAQTPAQLIADNLAALPHPDGTPRQLAGYSTNLLPEALREQITNAAKEIGESVVYLLETSGYRIVAADDMPTEDTTDPDAPPVANLHCIICDARLMSVALTNPSHCLTNGRLLIQGMSSLSPECPHGAIQS